MPRLLPDNSVSAGHEPRRFAATLRLSGMSAARGMDMAGIEKKLPAGVEILTPVSGGGLAVSATHAALEETMRVLNATAAPAWLMERLRSGYGKTGEDLTVVELSVTSDSNLVGRGVADLDAAELYDVAILGAHDARPLWHADRLANANTQPTRCSAKATSSSRPVRYPTCSASPAPRICLCWKRSLRWLWSRLAAFGGPSLTCSGLFHLEPKAIGSIEIPS